MRSPGPTGIEEGEDIFEGRSRGSVGLPRPPLKLPSQPPLSGEQASCLFPAQAESLCSLAISKAAGGDSRDEAAARHPSNHQVQGLFCTLVLGKALDFMVKMWDNCFV